jgi:hypothetical protein
LALVAQAAAVASAHGGAEGPRIDALGNIICSDHGDEAGTGKPDNVPHVPDCCLAGCLTGGVAGPPPAFVLFPPEARVLDRAGSRSAVAAGAPAELHPLNPRAPPA